MFKKGRTLTTFLEKQFEYEPSCIQVIKPGGPTSIQQTREREVKGHGIPKSGPADDLSASSMPAEFSLTAAMTVTPRPRLLMLK